MAAIGTFAAAALTAYNTLIVRKALNNTLKNEREQALLDVPRIYISNIGEKPDKTVTPPEQHTRISFVLTNFGSSPAIIKNLEAKLFFFEDYKRLSPINLLEHTGWKTDGAIIVADKGRSEPVLSREKSVPLEKIDTDANTAVYLMGFVDYSSLDGRSWKHVFCHKYVGGDHNAFKPSWHEGEAKLYNYTAETTKKKIKKKQPVQMTP